MLCINDKKYKTLYEGAMIVPTALCQADSIVGTRNAERKKVDVLEMKCLRRIVGVLLMDRVGNEKVIKSAGIGNELPSRVDHSVGCQLVTWRA